MTFGKFFGHDIDFSKSAQMWTYHHLILFLFAVGAIVLTINVSKKIKASSKEQLIKKIFIGILVFLELTYHIHNWTYPRFSLPLHVCSFAVIFSIALLLTNSKRIWEYAFFYGVIGGIMALTFPNSYGYTFYNFRYYHFILIHCVIISVPLYYYIAYGYRVSYKTTLRIFRDSFIFGVIIYFLNGLFGTNYWFIGYIPDNVAGTFKDFNFYILFFIFLVFLTMNILYFVSNFKEIKQKWTK